MTERSHHQSAAVEVESTADLELFRRLFELTAEGVVVLGARGRIIKSNPRGCELLGFERSELLLLSVQDLIPAEELGCRPLLAADPAAPPGPERICQLRGSGGRLLSASVTTCRLPGERTALLIRALPERSPGPAESRDSEERLRLVLQAANAGLYDLNLQTGEAGFTPEYATMLGYDPADLKLDLDLWTGWLHPEDRDRVLAILQSCIRGEVTSYECQFRMRTRMGDWKWIQSIGKVAAWGPAGRPARMIGTHTDITERKEAETALRESEQRFRQMFEHNRAVMLLIDPDSGAISDANPAAAAFYGYSRAALCRMVIEEINTLPPEQVKLRRKQAIVEPPGHFIFPHRLANGEIRTVEVYTSRIEVGGCPLLFSIIHDITERDQVESALRETEYFLTKSQAVTRLGSYKLDLATGVWNCTAVLDEIFGIDDHFPRTIAGWLELVVPEQRDEMRQHLLQHVVTLHNRFEREYRIIRHNDRKERWVCGLGELEFDTQGHPVRMIGTIQDITERKLAEEAVKESERKTRSIVESLPMGMRLYRLEPDGRLVFIGANPAADRILGVDHRQFYGKTIEEAFPPLVNTEVPARYRAAASSGEAWHTEQVEYHEGAIQGAFRVDVFQSSPNHMVACFENITERKKTETALREAEALYRTMFQASPEGMTLADLEGRITFASPKALEIYGVASQADATGRPLTDFVAPIDHPRAKTDFIEIIQGRYNHSQQYCLQRQDGTRFTGEINAALLRDAKGQPKGALLITRDITERIRAADALRSGQKLLSESQRIAHIGSWELDLRTEELLWTEECFRTCGLDPREYRPTLARLFELAVPDDRARFTAHVKTTLATRSFQPFEYRILRPDGTVRQLHVTGEVLCDETGAPTKLVGTQQDVTERSQAEESRLEMERRLLHAQKLESLGVLAGGIAHDFNNLLMAILGNIDLALMDLSPASPARLNIEQSALAARRAADLTRQMLAYAGKASFEVRRVNLSELCEENARLFRTCISKIVALNVHLDHKLPVIETDSGQIQQIIINLITNASEAIGDRPGAISLSTGVQTFDAAGLSRSRVDVIPQPGSFVFIEVADTGCGMDPPTQLRLFDPFFSTKSIGRGLGMSAILGIVRTHKGAIFVDSKVGQGTTIRVLFPAGEMPPVGKERRAASIQPFDHAGKKRASEGTIMVVDDEDMVRNVCVQILRRQGWEVIEAASGREAIELFRKNSTSIACVILDKSMPQMDGMTVFKELLTIQPGVKVILSSGYTNDQSPGESIAAEGLAGFIQKPYSLQGLRDELTRVLQRPA